MTQESDTNHRAQERENAEPEERIRPVPLVAAAITLAMVLFGVVYIFISDPFGNASLGDRRTVADLSGPVPAAAGAAVDGKAVFAAQCAACHQATGLGVPGAFPPLKGNVAVNSDDPTKQIDVVLDGLHGETVDGKAYSGVMTPFKGVLNDDEIAAIINHERSSWGNHGVEITPAQVAAQRTKAQ